MSQQRNSGEYHRADPAYRRQMKIWLAVTVVLGVGALALLRYWLGAMDLAASHGDTFQYERWLSRMLAALCIAFGVAAGAFALWLHRLATASRLERRWPPISMRSSSDVKIRYLTSADSLVTQLRSAAAVLAVLAVFFCAWAVYLLTSSG